MNVIVKNSDDSYFYLFKLISKEYEYKDNIDFDVEKIVFKKLDNLGYIKDTKINLEEILKTNKIKKIYVEEETILLKKILTKYNIKYKVLNSSVYYINEMDKLRAIILLKFILDENKESIYNLKFLILGNNNLSYSITNLLQKLNSYFETYNTTLKNVSLKKYDVIINTDNTKINPELLFDVKKNLIIYDLEPVYSQIDHHLLENNYIKYRFISNVSLYLPIAKANILYESMCENESL